MMQSLLGRLSSTDMDLVNTKTSLRFKDQTKFKDAESLIIHEQHLISDERLLELCQQEHNIILSTPKVNYVPRELLEEFKNYNVIIIDYIVSKATVILGEMPGDATQKIFSDRYTIKRMLIPLYYYVEVRTRQFGEPDFLAELPIVDKWDFIVQEALQKGAADITLTNTYGGAQVYYNVRKTKVHSARSLDKPDVGEIIKMLAADAGAAMADNSAKPRYFAIDINKHNRGRVVVNRTTYGSLATIRVLPKSLLNKSLEDLRLEPNTCTFIREVCLSPEKGLRLFIGETMSGKNTTILSALIELVKKDAMKIVSLEQPVEMLVEGIEQINAETDDEFTENADSLLRQNPDIIYFTEITDRTGITIMQCCNTAKAVFSSIHANSISQVLFRLQDITKLPLDRLILSIHSCVYQELVRDDKTDTVKPYNRCLYFDDDLKMRLYGKQMGEIIGILSAIENRWE